MTYTTHMSSTDSINVNKAVSSQEEGERKDSNILDPVSKQETAQQTELEASSHGERVTNNTHLSISMAFMMSLRSVRCLNDTLSRISSMSSLPRAKSNLSEVITKLGLREEHHDTLHILL